MSLFQEYLTAQEIAEAGERLRLKVVPHTKRRVLEMADRENWDASPLCRKRTGSQGGGGNEYHYTLLPLALQTALLTEHANKHSLILANQVQSKDVIVQEKVRLSDLDARQKEIMDARNGVLHHITLRMYQRGFSQRGAILSFLQDLEQGILVCELETMAMRANDKGRGLSHGTIARWFNLKENGGIVALAPKKTREKEDVPQWMKGFLKYYRLPQKPSISQAYERWCFDNQNAKLPTIRQVRHALNKLSAIDRQRGRMGSHELKTLKAYKMRDASDLMPASVYVADGKTFDAEIAHPLLGTPFKPEITTIIDAHSRKIVGWSSALSENAHAVIDALVMAVTRNAIPAIFYTDNGRGYKNEKMKHELTGFLSRLSITPSHAIAYNSQAKGVIENFNKRWTTLSREFPTYIGRDMDRQASQLVHKTTRKDIKEKGVSSLLPSWQEFLDACQDVVDRYNDTPQRGLEKIYDERLDKRRHLTPNEAWQLAVTNGFQADIVEREEALELQRPWEIRKTRRSLVEWCGNRYFAIELEAYHGKDVIVAYDIHDAQNVIVREIVLIDDERKPGKLIAVAQFEGHKTRFIPLSFEQQAMEKRHKGRKERAQKKVDAIDAELHAVTLEAYGANVASMVTIEKPQPVLVASNDDDNNSNHLRNSTTAQTAQGGLQSSKRPIFKDDVEYARWLLSNVERVTPRDQANIRDDLLSTKHNCDYLERQGIDLATLGKLARSAA